MKQDEFLTDLKNDLEKEFGQVRIKDNNIFLTINNTEVYCNIADIYRDYLITNDYKLTLHIYLQIIREAIEKQEEELNIDMIFPIIRKANFEGANSKRFYREELVDGVMIYMVEDKGELYKYITLEDIKNSRYSNIEIRDCAFKNINKITNELEKIDDDSSIYTLKYNNHLGASILLSQSFKRRLNKLKKTLLIAIPAQDVLIIAPFSYRNLEKMKQFTFEEIDEIYKVSNKIFKYKYGKLMPLNFTKNKLQLIK